MGLKHEDENLITEPLNESKDPIISEDDTTEANLQEGTSLRGLNDEPEDELSAEDLNGDDDS